MKKRCKVTPDNIKKWIKNGDGQGERENYKPFFKVRDVPSRGRSSIVQSIKTGRIHHYLSDLEYACHILAEYSPYVIDIREQVALLPWESTQHICNITGITHPKYPGNKTPTVMTSDLVLTLKINGVTSYAVISVKDSSSITSGAPHGETPPKKALKIRRTEEKLVVEKLYWRMRNIPWQLVTQNEIPMVRAHNLDMLRVGVVAKEVDYLNQYLKDFSSYFQSIWDPHKSWNRLLRSSAEFFNLGQDESFALFARAVWTRLLPVDLDAAKLHHEEPLPRKVNIGEERCWISTLFLV